LPTNDAEEEVEEQADEQCGHEASEDDDGRLVVAALLESKKMKWFIIF